MEFAPIGLDCNLFEKLGLENANWMSFGGKDYWTKANLMNALFKINEQYN